MTKKGDVNLSLSASLALKIKEIIASSNGSYELVTEFVRDAIREKMERLENIKKIRQE